MLVTVVEIGRVVVRVHARLVAMGVAVLSRGHAIVRVIVMAVVVAMRVLVLEGIVVVVMAVLLGEL